MERPQYNAGNGTTANGSNESRAGIDYDLLPYLSMPVAYTQPAHLAARAALFGLSSPTADRARVLELGCAAGGNLIPLAARFPQAHFLGIDLSTRQIADGRNRIAAFGLTNIELRQGDIAALTLPANSFDYVICHGVFSWVPPLTQDAIFRIINNCLVDNGVATISYNVLPGWHLRSPVRDILLHHAGVDGTPQARVALARDMLRQIETATSGRHAYGSVLRDEAKRMRLMPASYILGEFLAENNAPATFRNFTGKAERHDLCFLGEADLNAEANELITPDARRDLERLARTDRNEAEQRLDLFSGRPFRRSLLVKTSTARSLSAPKPERLTGLYLTSRLVPDPARTKDRTIAFVDGRGRSIATQTPCVGRALMQLATAYPATAPVDTLTGAGPDSTRIAKVLLRLLSEGRASVSTLPLAAGGATEVRPRAWVLARAEAAMGQPFVTSMRHVAVELPRIAAGVTARLDGTNDRNALAQWLARALAAGTVHLPDQEAPLPGGEALVAVARSHVEETLRHLAVGAVLLPPSARTESHSAT